MQTRRKFLRDCSLTAATLALTPAAVRAGNPHVREIPRDLSLSKRFAGALNSTFTLRTGSGPVKLLLVNVNVLPTALAKADDSATEQFTLLFRGPARQPLEQDTYSFEHPRLGRQSIFIVPMVRLGSVHRHYEAVFNRVINPDELAAQIARAPRRIVKQTTPSI